MTQENSRDANCAILEAMDILGGKWRLPILWRLSFGTLRYNELKRQVYGITNIMLTRSLQELESYKLVTRVQYDKVPPMVEYSLSSDGEKLIPALLELKKWVEGRSAA
ncbi:MAG: helix-turn-helix transcriptional regulator [Coriobacteriia bacterium]|nr:helix-turn-helix transcriptional regulator [Coriobacteriia bacterium]